MSIQSRLCAIFMLLLLVHVQLTALGKTARPTPRQIDSVNEQAYKLIHDNIAKAFIMLTDAEQAAAKIKYKKGLAVNYLYQAEIFNQRGFYKRAVVLYYLSINLSRQNHDLYNVGRAQGHISSIDRKMGRYREAEKLLQSSLQIFRQLHKPLDEVNILLRLGLNEQKQYRTANALTWFNQAHQLAVRQHYNYGEKKSYFYRAELYNELGQTDSSAYYYHKTLHIDTLTKDAFGKTLSYTGLGQVYLKSGKAGEALGYGKLAFANADSLHIKELQINAIELMLKASNAKHDLAATTYWQEKLLEVERQASNIDRKDAGIFIEVLKQQQEKQLAIQKDISEIERVSQTKTIMLVCFLVVMVIVVLLISSISYNYHKAKKYAADLDEKNRLIEDHSRSVALLNEKILGQNAILEEDNRLKNKLLSVISHDLRHPLTNTKSILDLVNMKLVTHEEAQTLFDQLEAQYGRAVTLLDNLLYWIKSQVHGSYVKKENIAVYRLIDHLIDEQKMPLQKKHLQVWNEIDADTEWYAEQELLKIVLRNLLTNAIKFTRPGGEIRFSAQTTEYGLNITVRDNGIGMNADTLRKVSVDNHYTSKGTANEDGSGLGLMLIRDLIKNINGDLLIQSEPGKGSTFTVCLVYVEETYLQPEEN